MSGERGKKGREGRKEVRKYERKKQREKREGGRNKDCVYILRHKKPSSTLLSDETQVKC